ncbi:MAG: ImmA/IrrE family metallo-endopeptidase [Lachnospiraceae bacterium]|nr:ImmA/IrrE family metallo-endopeptidase [Lachnospiraceae bacterium]
MPTVKVSIQPEIISWAMSQTDESQLGTALLSNIRKWLDGTKTPTFNQIEEFSRKSHIPLGYFFLQKPPVENIELLEYRTIDSVELANPSRDMIDTINDMKRVQDWMKEYRQETGFDTLRIVGSLSGQKEHEYIAECIRQDMDLDREWFRQQKDANDSFKYIRGQLEESGVLVMLNGIVGKNTHRALNINEFRAFAMVDEWAPLIFINSVDSQGAKVFSLFHEIAHIWLGEDDLYNDRGNSENVNQIEVICNAVASELMVPFDVFLNEWNSINEGDEQETITCLSRVFNCSKTVIARKALDIKKISKKMYDDIVEDAIIEYKTMKENKTSGGNYYNNAKNRLDGCFVKALCNSVASGRTTFTEVFRLTNTSRKTFLEVASSLGGEI